MTAPGSSELDTPEVRAYYEQRFGERYVAVQWHPGAANRKERRERKFRPKLNAVKLAQAELEGRAIKPPTSTREVDNAV